MLVAGAIVVLTGLVAAMLGIPDVGQRRESVPNFHRSLYCAPPADCRHFGPAAAIASLICLTANPSRGASTHMDHRVAGAA